MLENVENKALNILLVDDDETLLKFFKIHLNKYFSHITVVKSAKEAIEAITARSIDLVISDVRMPKEDGIQLMRKIRLQDPSIPVFLISGATFNLNQSVKIENKADAFLEKPFELQSLHGFIMRGIKTREIYRELFHLIADEKKFVRLVRGKSFPKIIDPNDRQRAKELKALLQRLEVEFISEKPKTA